MEIADLLEALGRLLDISILFSKTKTVVKILIDNPSWRGAHDFQERISETELIDDAGF